MSSTITAGSTAAERFDTASSRTGQDVGLLTLRLALGLTLAAHGTQKLFGWFGGYGIHGTGQFFATLGYPSPDSMAVIAGLVETLGGLALAIGLLTPLAAAALAGDMLNAVAAKWTGGFFAPKGMEYELLITLTAVGLALTGPGAFAVDRAIPALRSLRARHGLAVLALGLVVGVVFLLIK